MPAIETRWMTLSSGVRLELAERGSGLPILFLHGFTDSWRSFESVMRRMPEGYRCLALTQRGHGDSSRPQGGYGIDGFAADAAEVIDKLGLQEVAVVGHSMGSLVARGLALFRPDRVSHLVLVGSGVRFDRAVAELTAATHDLVDPVPWDFVHEFQRSTIHRPLPAGQLETFVSESMKLPARVWRSALAGIAADFTAIRLGEIRTPTLLVWGEHDAIASAAEQERLLAEIPDCSLLTYEGIGHCPNWEVPDRFVRDLTEFLAPTRSAVAAADAPLQRSTAE